MKTTSPSLRTKPLAHAWHVLVILTWTHFKLRYYGSFLGYFWSLLKPLGLFGVLYIVFSVYLKQSIPHYKTFLLLGIILWEFFSQGTSAGMMGLITNKQIIQKLYLPRIILVISAVSSSFISLVFNLIIFLLFACVDGITWNFGMLWFLPLLLSLYLLVIGIGLILSIVVVKLRDMMSIWDLAMQLGFWLTPVMYSSTVIPEKWRDYLFMNPMCGILDYSRYFLIGVGEMTLAGYGYVVALSLALLIIGICFFQEKESQMIEFL